MNIEDIKVGSEYYHYRKDPDDKSGPPVEVGRSKVLDICPKEDGRNYVLVETSMVQHVLFGPRYSDAHSAIPASWIISLAPPEPPAVQFIGGPSVEELQNQIKSLKQDILIRDNKPWYQFWK